MGIALRQGRLIEPADRDRHVAVISESVAKKVWPGENPLGKQFHPGDDEKPLTEIIGVVADIRTVALDEPPLLMVYHPAGPASRNWEVRSRWWFARRLRRRHWARLCAARSAAWIPGFQSGTSAHD